MPRFVILLHELPPDAHRPSHWDLMLESGETLQTWALAVAPSHDAPPSVIVAEQLPDHRLAYLEFEGPLAGHRGRVSRWDAGQYVRLHESPDRLLVQLEGGRFRGQLDLRRHCATGNSWEVRTVAVVPPESRGDSATRREPRERRETM